MELKRFGLLVVPLLVALTFLEGINGQGFACDEFYVADAERIDCGNPNTEEAECRANNCTWCPTGGPAPIPWCYHPPQSAPVHPGAYRMVGDPMIDPNGISATLEKIESSTSWPGEPPVLTFSANFESNYRLRVKISDDNPNRFVPPVEIMTPEGGNAELLYDVVLSNDPVFTFKIIRKSSNEVLFDSGAGGKFIFSDQFTTLSWKLPSENVYGIGENEQHSFKHDFTKNYTYGVWAYGHNLEFGVNLYGAQPYYTVLENDGNAHSVMVLNTNAQQFSMLSGPMVKYITTGGILDFMFFLGPTPENTVQQFTEAVGRAPIPPYWALGFQICRYGYNTLENMKLVVDRTEEFDIPHDVQYGDIDIMDRELDFTYDKDRFAGLPEYIRELKSKGIKFITILDPIISIGEPAGTYRPFESGQEMDVWIKRPDGTPATGRMWPDDDVYFPDYSNPVTREWWSLMIKEFHDVLEYDGFWVDMNEPSNFVYGDVQGCAVNQWNNPPYQPPLRGGPLPSNTICMDNVEFAGRHYDTHSMFAWFQSEPTLIGVQQGTGKRGIVLTRSNYLGSGRWAAHWLGDNYSTWPNLQYSIIGMLQYNQFGTPLVGPDICGHNGDASPELCQRWMELGAFYPFSRNHNGLGQPDKDPAAFGLEVAESTRTALRIRYTLLPYLYTLFYFHNQRGDTVARALWHVFPKDSQTVGIDRQFFWGEGLMISPALEEGETSVNAYFPNSRFYNYYDGSLVEASGTFETISAPRDFIPLHIHGGHIIPTQEPARNTEIARNNPFGLIVALSEIGEAAGHLFYDDGDSLDSEAVFFTVYTAKNRQIENQVTLDNYTEMGSKILNTIRLLGATDVTEVTVNGSPHNDFQILPSGEVLISNLGLVPNTDFIITY